jgi:secondary thiamine-phosphate synthase enzyme
MTLQHSLTLSLDAEFGHRDITADVSAWVTDSGIRTGICALQSVGSTGAITTIEYEAGALEDLHRAVEELAPARGPYAHNERWGDGNGFSHVRSALLKTGLTVPIVDGRLELGTWQQIVVINFDNRPRERRISAVIVGD